MHTADTLFLVPLDQAEATGPETGDETIDLDRLVHLVDETGLLRLGLTVLERVAQAEGRILWH